MLTGQSTTNRRGFTLIELLIVMSIILFLMSAVVVVIGNTITGAREAATRATITKINGLIQQRVEAFQRSLDRSDKQALNDRTQAFLMGTPAQPGPLTSSPGGMPFKLVNNASDRTWAVLGRKLLFLQNFPQSFREVGGFDDLSASPPQVTGVPGTMLDDDSDGVINFYGNGFPDVDEFGKGTNHVDVLAFGDVLRQKGSNLQPLRHTPGTESSELMYILLTQAKLFGVPPVDGNEFTSAEVRDTDGDGLLEFIDAWEQPLRFYRWPTQLLRCGEDLNDDGNLDTSPINEDLNGNGTLDPPGFRSLVNPVYANLLDGSLPSIKKKDPVLMRDPDDSFGLISSQLLKFGSPSATVEASRRQRFEQVFHTAETYHHLLIVSSGADKQLGIYEPGDRGNGGHLARLINRGDPGSNPINDNLTNRRR
jgi:prepilin-type N-terminal cleavage/methylation domain-containing protein